MEEKKNIGSLEERRARGAARGQRGRRRGGRGLRAGRGGADRARFPRRPRTGPEPTSRASPRSTAAASTARPTTSAPARTRTRTRRLESPRRKNLEAISKAIDSAQLDLPLAGLRGADEPLRDRAPRLGGDPRAAGGRRPGDRHRPLPDRLLARGRRRGARGDRGDRDPGRGRRRRSASAATSRRRPPV